LLAVQESAALAVPKPCLRSAIGDASQAARQHAHLLAEAITPMRLRNLSPRRAETRQPVGDLLERLMCDYALDGPKIGFLDSLALDNLVASDSDCPTLGEGIYDILSAAIERAQAIRPDALIQFRNSYANLASRRYANLYRFLPLCRFFFARPGEKEPTKEVKYHAAAGKKVHNYDKHVDRPGGYDSRAIP
jgi:hypothetical protein